MGDIVVLFLGVAVFLITGVIFWLLLPDGDKLHRWANTEWEPYISVAICTGIALSFTMILSSFLNLIGT